MKNYTARKDTKDLVNALNAYAKRTSGITSVRASYFYNMVCIDIHAPKSCGKVYNEMVEYLTAHMLSREVDATADWYRSYNEYDLDNGLLDEYETVVDICVYHF